MDNDTIIVKDGFITPLMMSPFNDIIERSTFDGVDYFGRFYPGVAPSNKTVDACVEMSLQSLLGFPVELVLSMMRLECKDDQPTAWIHADTVCASEFSLVGYMNESPLAWGGTGFWKHNIVGHTNESFKDNEVAQRFIDRDAHTMDNWQLTDLVGYKKNRAVIFPSDRFHSRYPRESFGTCKETGRLIFVAFFNRKDN